MGFCFIETLEIEEQISIVILSKGGITMMADRFPLFDAFQAMLDARSKPSLLVSGVVRVQRMAAKSIW